MFIKNLRNDIFIAVFACMVTVPLGKRLRRQVACYICNNIGIPDFLFRSNAGCKLSPFIFGHKFLYLNTKKFDVTLVF